MWILNHLHSFLISIFEMCIKDSCITFISSPCTETRLTMNVEHTSHINVFQNNDDKCNGYKDCTFVKRIMTALSYYNKVSSQKPQQFITFCDKYYSKNYLQDYIHFICVHKNDINKHQ
eukprot:75251_1